MEDFNQELKDMKEAIATLSSSVVELEGRIRCLENYIKEEEEAELAIKTKKNGGILRAKEIEFRA